MSSRLLIHPRTRPFLPWVPRGRGRGQPEQCQVEAAGGPGCGRDDDHPVAQPPGHLAAGGAHDAAARGG